MSHRTVSRAPRESAAIDCSIENVFHGKKNTCLKCRLFYIILSIFFYHTFLNFPEINSWQILLFIVYSGVKARVHFFLYTIFDEQDPRVPCARDKKIHLTEHYFLFTQTPRASYSHYVNTYNIYYISIMLRPSQLNYAKSYTTASHMTMMMMMMMTAYILYKIYVCIKPILQQCDDNLILLSCARAFDWSQQISDKTDPWQQYTSTRRNGWWTKRVYKACIVTRSIAIAFKSVVLLRHSVYKTISYTYMISCRTCTRVQSRSTHRPFPTVI